MPTRVPASGNPYIDGLLWSWKWDTTKLTYSAPNGTAEYGYGIQGFQQMNAVQRAAMVDVIDMFNDVCGLNIRPAAAGTVASLRFAEASAVDQENDGSYTNIPTAIGTPPDPTQFPAIGHGDMFFNSNDYNNPLLGTFAHVTFIHELGHAVGLKHGHEQSQAYGALPAEFDSSEYSVMTYRDYPGDEIDFIETEEGGKPQSLMMFDIAALQYMYGADFRTNSTATTYRWSTTTGEMFVNDVGQGAATENRIFRTIWDGGGLDTYDFSNYRTGVTVDLRPGSYCIASQAQLSDLGDGVTARGNIFNAFQYEGSVRSLIENAVGGSANDFLYGNDVANTLKGGRGSDYLYGFGGNDRLIGGASGDRFAFDEDWGLDTISDWQDSIGAERTFDKLDRIDLSGLRDENGGARLTLKDLLITQAGENVNIFLDLNRNKVADRIDLDGDGTVDPVRITVLDATATHFQAFDFIL